MCTAGFWKDKNGQIIYFKNRDNSHSHVNERYEHIDGGLFIQDDGGKCEGMNKNGTFAVGLTLKPLDGPAREDHNPHLRDALFSAGCPKGILEFIIDRHKKHAFAGSFIIGDSERVFLLETVPGRSAYADLSDAKYFVQTNHGNLLLDEGAASKNPTRERLCTCRRLIKDVASAVDLKAMLAHHEEDGRGSVCRHKGEGVTWTQSSYLFYSLDRKAEILIGDYPCKGTYKTETIGGG